MKWIKIQRKCSMGKRGDILQVNDAQAKSWINTGMAKECEAPEKRAALRPAVSNKAMSAAE